MEVLTMEQMEKVICDRLVEWVGAVNLLTEDSIILSVDLKHNRDIQYTSAYALVLHEESSLEVLYLFPNTIGGAELSCEKRIQLCDMDVDNAEELNSAIRHTVEKVYKSSISLVNDNQNNEDGSNSVITKAEGIYDTCLSLINVEKPNASVNQVIVKTAKDVYEAVFRRSK